MTSLLRKPWSAREHLHLLTVYKSDIDWERRAGKMAKEFSDTRQKGFFNAKSCQSEYDRLMAEPCPGLEDPASAAPSLVTKSYNHKIVIDAWVKHFEKELIEEELRAGELELVELRKKAAIVERIWGGKRPYSDEEIIAIVEEARRVDAERAKTDQTVEDIVNVYISRLTEVMNERDGQAVSPTRLPPTKKPIHSPRGVNTAFRTPSPSRSPVMSPIRPMADAYREAAESPIRIRRITEQQPEVKLENEEVLTPAAKVALSHHSTTSSTDSNSKKRRPGRPAKRTPISNLHLRQTESPEDVDSPAPNADAKTEDASSIVQPTVDETSTPATEGRSRRTSSKHEEKKEVEIKVEESPAGRRNVRQRGTVAVADSPLTVNRPSKRESRQRAGADSSPTEDIHHEVEEKKSRTSTDGRGHKAGSEVSDVSISAPPSVAPSDISLALLSQPYGTLSCQTDISIQGTLWNAKHDKKERRASVCSRKSAVRTSSDTQEGSIRDVACQTHRVEFEKTDKVVITWISNEKPFIRTVNVDEEKKEDDWSDDDDIALSNVKKANTSIAPTEEEEEPEEKRSRGNDKREIAVIYETEDWIARELAKLPGYEYVPEPMPTSPVKRARKEEKLKEETSAPIKWMLNNSLRNMLAHRHSGIFSHPVHEKDAPGYTNAVKTRMDLHTIKKEIESGVINSFTILKHKLYLMFANAVMFNSTAHDVNTYAKDMAADTMNDFKLAAEERKMKFSGHPRRSKVGEEASKKTPASQRIFRPLPNLDLSGDIGSKRKVFKRTLGNR